MMPSDLRVGLTAVFEREISEADVLAFANNSGDLNPLHVDPQYAQSTRLGARVVHGAYQIALASAMLGMHLPGENSFLVSTNAQFQRPLYFPCRVSVKGEITSWDPHDKRGNLRVTVTELATATTTGQIHMGFTIHERGPQRAAPSVKEPLPCVEGDTKLLLLTGASGGIGSALVADLAQKYSIVALVNRRSLPPELQGHPNVSQFRVDLSSPQWRWQVEELLGNKPLYGIVHAAWPGLAQGGLLGSSRTVLQQQLAFATFETIELARLLTNKGERDGSRLIVLGSMAGRQRPTLATAVYSLAKASLEHTVSLLAPELALKKITINTLCPSFLPLGLNERASERQKLLAQAAAPLGRLCQTSDILGAVRYLLSSEACFLSGQSIALSGGQL